MINLELSKKLFNESFYPLLFDYSHRFEVYLGSAGSGKSVFIAQKLLIRCLNEQLRILVCRKTLKSIEESTFSLFKELLTNWKISKYVKIKQSPFKITFPNGSEILFTGLDEETKLLSLNDISAVWIEEAYEVSRDIVEQLNLRMRGSNSNQQIILSFNPISSHSWLYEFCNNPPESYLFHHSTYKDNKFLPKEYIASLEELYTRNPQKARIYCDGEWGIDTDGLVLKNWVVEEFDEYQLANKFEHRTGSDLGFIDPTTIVDTLYDKQNKIIYVFNEFYKSGCQLDEVYQAMVEMKLTKQKIYMDSAEPRSIDYFRRQGIHAVPCIKGQNSVNSRIAFLQNHKIIVKPECKNVIMELSNFSYEKDRKTGQYTDNTTHEFSHAIDGMGYAYSDIYTRSGLRTIDKSILGL